MLLLQFIFVKICFGKALNHLASESCKTQHECEKKKNGMLMHPLSIHFKVMMCQSRKTLLFHFSIISGNGNTQPTKNAE